MPALLEARNLVRLHPFGQRRLLENISLTLQGGRSGGSGGPLGFGQDPAAKGFGTIRCHRRRPGIMARPPIRNQDVPGFRRRAIYFHQRPSILADTVEAALRQPLALAIHRGRNSISPGSSNDWLLWAAMKNSWNKKWPISPAAKCKSRPCSAALQLEPNVLLLDEPTSALDPKTAAAVEQWLTAWIDQSPDDRAMIWVTHDVNQANAWPIARCTWKTDD